MRRSATSNSERHSVVQTAFAYGCILQISPGIDRTAKSYGNADVLAGRTQASLLKDVISWQHIPMQLRRST